MHAELFSDDERLVVGEAIDALLPGATDLGAVDYVERLLTAFDHDPPRIWAAPGSWSGSTARWLELGPWERQAWQARIEEYRTVYRRVAERRQAPGDTSVVYSHACEATYGDPAYGGNRDSGGWERIDFPEPLFPPSRENA